MTALPLGPPKSRQSGNGPFSVDLRYRLDNRWMSAPRERSRSIYRSRTAGLSHFSPFPPSLVDESGEHEWTSEVRKRETTAECRLVGHHSTYHHSVEADRLRLLPCKIVRTLKFFQLLPAPVHRFKHGREFRLSNPYTALFFFARQVRLTLSRIGADASERMNNQVSLAPDMVKFSKKVVHLCSTCRVGCVLTVRQGFQFHEPVVETAAQPRRCLVFPPKQCIA